MRASQQARGRQASRHSRVVPRASWSCGAARSSPDGRQACGVCGSPGAKRSPRLASVAERVRRASRQAARQAGAHGPPALSTLRALVPATLAAVSAPSQRECEHAQAVSAVSHQARRLAAVTREACVMRVPRSDGRPRCLLSIQRARRVLRVRPGPPGARTATVRTVFTHGGARRVSRPSALSWPPRSAARLARAVPAQHSRD